MSAWADKSESINEVSKAFVSALGALEDVTKNKKANAGQFEYAYADLATTVAMTRKVLAGHGLAVTQTAGSEGDDVLVWTTVVHESGQFLTAQPLRLPAGKTAQQTGSALSYARRYSLMAFLGLATEDDDGQSAQGRATSSKRLTTRSTGSSVEARSSEESRIREIIVALDVERQKQVRSAFKDEFGSNLSDLPVGRHAEALKWVEAFA